MMRALSSTVESVRLPAHASDMRRKVREARRVLSQVLQREPTLEEVSAKTKIEVEKIRAVEVKSWHASIDGNPFSSEGVALVNAIAEKREAGPERYAEDHDREMLRSVVESVLQALPFRQREILMRRQQGLTLEAIGVIFGITKERVRQIELHALRSLRARPDLLKKLEPFLEEESTPKAP
jgi:RNA polymerase primary sigma factor